MEEKLKGLRIIVGTNYAIIDDVIQGTNGYYCIIAHDTKCDEKKYNLIVNSRIYDGFCKGIRVSLIYEHDNMETKDSISYFGLDPNQEGILFTYKTSQVACTKIEYIKGAKPKTTNWEIQIDDIVETDNGDYLIMGRENEEPITIAERDLQRFLKRNEKITYETIDTKLIYELS